MKRNLIIKQPIIKGKQTIKRAAIDLLHQPESARPSQKLSGKLEPILLESQKKFTGPMSGVNAYENYRNFLSEREEFEIQTVMEVYYIRPTPVYSKKPLLISSNVFSFQKDDHIAFRYQQLQVVGEGSYGVVVKCLDHKYNENVAIKMIKDLRKIHDQLILEKDLLVSLQKDGGPENSHIIKYKEHFLFRGYFCIVMELASINIYTLISNQPFIPFSSNLIRLIAKQVAESLHFIHTRGVIHSDIKPENIVFTSKRKNAIKLIDFGCSCLRNNTLYTYIQSRFYRAPEIVLESPYSTEIDIWSYGCLLCEISTGKPLFEADDENELISMIFSLIGLPPLNTLSNSKRAHYYFNNEGSPLPSLFIKKRSFEDSTGITDPYLLSLIKMCIKWDPSERPTALKILQHQYFTREKESSGGYMRT